MEDRFILWAQVRSGTPRMRIDSGGVLRPERWPDGGGKVYLGDVASSFLSALGPHAPPEFIEHPGFDEQRWTLAASSSGLQIIIRSESYWGFALLARCYLNRIEIVGERSDVGRLVMDVLASLGHNPWNAAFGWAFRRHTGLSIPEHREEWSGLASSGKEEMDAAINLLEDRLRKLKSRTVSVIKTHVEGARNDIDRARKALLERNLPSAMRAMARAEKELILADPDTRSDIDDIEEDEDEIPYVDLTGEE
ncbi:MAG: hypothetical protein DBX05_03255 [Candidatus Poseidoniales archaeon]|nr:MAG: hypothetical protein CMA23_000075 [Euryarchaeota archaeon]RCH73819.1 MAG: hypothetical protein DBX05_03255 [Candidatus Poseidoniales archaeon]|tara:strand:- start:892 stop:1644 length:753 start_codon:yes stop_codon:yes gene_type:complete